jgi:hypothetical protein
MIYAYWIIITKILEIQVYLLYSEEEQLTLWIRAIYSISIAPDILNEFTLPFPTT